MATALLDYSKERQFRKLSEKSSESVSCVLRGGEQVDIDTKERILRTMGSDYGEIARSGSLPY